MAVDILIEKIEPLVDHVEDSCRKDRLVRSLRKEGWRGRPLLVVKYNDQYRALTGTHRYFAAKECRLSTIPCCVIDGAEMTAAGIEYQKVRKEPDHDRRKMLCNFPCAVALIYEEIGENNKDHLQREKGCFEYR